MMAENSSIQRISVIVPENPFMPPDLKLTQCLCALSVQKLMDWWPGTPHAPHRNPIKVRSIQRSLEWKRVAQIAAYLLQEEIVNVPDRLDKYFTDVYEPKKNEPGREWPPRVPRVVGYQRSEFPTFSNILIHVNGGKIEPYGTSEMERQAAILVFDENDARLNFSVIDGQHRINGAFFALKIRAEMNSAVEWEIPAEVFLDLDKPSDPPRRQAQIFIDVNFYQKKVDRSLVADLFPTARGDRGPLDYKERAQDIGRKLMLETGPLVGMIQIPGIRYGVKDVITLATLASAVERELITLVEKDITDLESQTEFLAQCLEAWLEASGRFENLLDVRTKQLNPQNVVYQSRVLVGVLDIIPAMIWHLQQKELQLLSKQAQKELITWLHLLAKRAGLIKKDQFLAKEEFKKRGYLGSGGIGRFRNVLWAAAMSRKSVARRKAEAIADLAERARERIFRDLRDGSN